MPFRDKRLHYKHVQEELLSRLIDWTSRLICLTLLGQFRRQLLHLWPSETVLCTIKAVRVRTNKANFGPSPIGLIFSVKVNHYIQCTNIAFVRSSPVFFSFFSQTVFKVTSKLANLPWQTLKFCYKRRTLPKHSVLF